MGKYKSVIFLGLGIMIALATSLMTYEWLQKNAAAKMNNPIKKADIAVATVNLPWGRVIAENMVTYKPYIKDSLPDGYIPKETPITGRVVISPIMAGEPIFESRLAPLDIESGGVAAVIKPKNRAMAVKVDKVIGVSGFIYPGNRVDVLVTLRKENNKVPITKIVLENVLVLAVGTKIENENKGQKSQQVDVITLEVSPTEAEKLAHAATEGKIQLAMRNFMDTADVLTKGSTRNTLLNSYSSHKPKKTYRKRSKYATVEMIRGSELSKVKVDWR